MEVIFRSHTLDDGDVVCLAIIKVGHKFWFSANDIANLLEYEYPNEICFNVRLETWKEWGEFKSKMEQAPSYWKSDTTLISEVGFLRLLCKSTKPKADELERWIFDDVLPSLREVDQYKLEKSYHEQLTIKDREITKLRDKVLEIYDR